MSTLPSALLQVSKLSRHFGGCRVVHSKRSVNHALPLIGGLRLELPLQPVRSPSHVAACVVRKPHDACVRDAELTCFSAAFPERCRKKCRRDCASSVARPFAWSAFPYPPASNQALSPARAFSLPPEAIRWRDAWAIALRPSGVLGPLLKPPWLRHRPLGNALALQGSPVLRA